MPTEFRLAKYEFYLAPDEQINLPQHSGSTLRGGFGRAFRDVVCVSRERDCSPCLLRENCVFPRIFDTAPPDGWGRMPDQSKAPRPFVLEPPMDVTYQPGQVIQFGLILMGYAAEYLPYFIFSFQELGKKFGIGKGRGRFRIAEVRSVSLDRSDQVYSGEHKLLKDCTHITDMNAIYEHLKGYTPNSLTLDFVTPTRITRLGDMVGGDEFRFEHLIRAIFRRASMLASLFCGSEWSLDYASLLEKARKVKASNCGQSLRKWGRYSWRQQMRIAAEGFIGPVSLEGNLKEFLPFIKLGELIHVGKGTTFGMGKYVIRG